MLLLSFCVFAKVSIRTCLHVIAHVLVVAALLVLGAILGNNTVLE